MNPGRELDKIIAERVMGWRFTPTNYSTGEPGGLVYRRPDGSEGFTDEGDWEFLPPYSTKIAAAWEVVSHLSSKGMSVTVSGPYETENGDAKRWHAGFELRDQFSDEHTEAWESSAPHAICMSALKAVSPSP